jgi:hypothetical protein
MSALGPTALKREAERYLGSGARSPENYAAGLRPAFIDRETGVVYVSRFADRRPAPFHLLDGLQDEVVLERRSCGRVVTVKPSVVSGFVLHRHFLTRDEVAS